MNQKEFNLSISTAMLKLSSQAIVKILKIKVSKAHSSKGKNNIGRGKITSSSKEKV